ncbi:hypothetical protein KJ766_00265 [Patescibacteria group bacterium]|nr:hypothetical protein [Patescibacteria group bacterium]
MTDSTLRFYKYAIQIPSDREKKINDLKKSFRTKVSRRRARQQIQNIIQRLNPSKTTN